MTPPRRGSAEGDGGRRKPRLEALLRIREEEEGALVLSATVVAEVDYLFGVRFGAVARRAFFSDLAAQRYDVAWSIFASS